MLLTLALTWMQEITMDGQLWIEQEKKDILMSSATSASLSKRWRHFFQPLEKTRCETSQGLLTKKFVHYSIHPDPYKDFTNAQNVQ